jgi:sec-independent protein translocase protein TatC
MPKNNNIPLEDKILSDDEALQDKDAPSELKAATIMQHLKELKTRVIYSLLAFIFASIFCYLFVNEIYGFLVKPLAEIYAGQPERKMIFTGLTEAFITYLKLAVFAGFVISFPFTSWQFYAFTAPALYKSEKFFLTLFTIAAPILFLLGAALAYYFIFPAAWKFFVSFEVLDKNNGLPILLEAKVSEYLSLVTSLILAFGLSFQLPVILILFCKMGFITADMLKKGRKYSVVILLSIAGIVTPPDVFSQVALFVPLQLLYEISIVFCKMIDKNKIIKNNEDITENSKFNEFAEEK